MWGLESVSQVCHCVAYSNFCSAGSAWRHTGTVAVWTLLLASMDNGLIPIWDQVFFIFLIIGTTSKLFGWFMAFMYFSCILLLRPIQCKMD